MSRDKKISNSSSKKISRVSIVDQVCESIRQNIADGVWKPGERLPSEADFSELYGVNRLSVRMALQKLSTLGLIETRVGEGSFVVEKFSMQQFLSEISFVYEKKENYIEVQQLRILLEGECMNLAILHATPEEKEHLKHKLDSYDEAAEIYNQDIDNVEKLQNMVDADFAFHFEIVKMSHNNLYKDVYSMLQQPVRRHILEQISSRTKRRSDSGLPPLTNESDLHTEMYNGIMNGDKEEARTATEKILGIRPIYGLDTFDE